MAYETGSASNPTDLLQKMVTWLVSRGWTQNMSKADSLGWRAHLSKGGTYVNLRSNIGSGTGVWGGGVGPGTNYNGIGIYVGTGFSSGSGWNAQAGGPIGSGQTYTVGAWMPLPSGAITGYHFFDDGSDNIAIIVERSSGLYTHMGWGPSIIKSGSVTGGAYFFASLSGYHGNHSSDPGSAALTAECPAVFYSGSCASFVRANVDTFTGKWIGLGDTATASLGFTGWKGTSWIQYSAALPSGIPGFPKSIIGRLTNSLNSQTCMMPVAIFAERDGGGYSMLGRIPNIFSTNATVKGFAAGGSVLIGSDTYMLFHNFAVRKVS